MASRGMLGRVGVPATSDAALSANLARLVTFGHRIVSTIKGDSDPRTFIPELIAHHQAGRFPFDRLVKTFPLTEINTAIVKQAEGRCVKIVLLP